MALSKFSRFIFHFCFLDAINEKIEGKFLQILEGELEKSDKTPNGDTIAYIQATRQCFMMQSGKEALDLMAKSERIRSDIEQAKNYRLEICIILREWKLMDSSMEFRSFVFKGKLNAVSQYCYYQYYPQMIQKKDKIEESVKNLFEKFKPHMKFENAIIDFYVEEKEGEMKSEIIELNPWFSDTSACLFDWSKDVRQLKEGPFVFKVIEFPLQDCYDCLPINWKRWFLDLRTKKEENNCIVN